MSLISASINFKPTSDAFKALGRRGLMGQVRALNRTATSERAALSSAISKDMGLRVGVVKEALVIGKATPTRLTASITVRGKKIPLIDFTPVRGPEPSRGRGRGVSAKLPGGAGRYPHAFIATMRSGHRGVYERVGKSRLPIYELHGPSISFVFQKHVPLGAVRRNETLQKNLQHEFEFASMAS